MYVENQKILNLQITFKNKKIRGFAQSDFQIYKLTLFKDA
jgi:hypothetical protein